MPAREEKAEERPGEAQRKDKGVDPSQTEGKPKSKRMFEQLFLVSSSQEAGAKQQLAEEQPRSTSEPAPSSQRAASDNVSRKRRMTASPPSETGAESKGLKRLKEGEGIKSSVKLRGQSAHAESSVTQSESHPIKAAETELEIAKATSSPIKSEIAPWMTQRHKRAIRRSLQAQILSSSPAQTARSDHDEGRHITAEGKKPTM